MSTPPHQMERRQRKPKGDRLDPALFASDDQTPEEIERMFKSRENRDQSGVPEAPGKPKKRIDPLYYALYAGDDQSAAEIEARFAILEQSVEAAGGVTTEDVARKAFTAYANPKEIPLEVWIDLEDPGHADDDSEDFALSFGDRDGDDFVTHRVRRPGARGSRPARAAHRSSLITAVSIEHLGAGVDLWPAYKVAQLSAAGGVFVHREFPNRETMRTTSHWRREVQGSARLHHIVDHLDAATFWELVGPQCDCVLMDPPFGHGGWTGQRFLRFLEELKPRLDRCFFVVWVDPHHLPIVVKTMRLAGFVFCDSMCVELLDSFCRPFVIKGDRFGFPRDSRMAIMFRTNDINRCDLKHQRVKDTGYGIVAENSKTYGRPSMPMTLHTIIEVMLPHRKTGPRVFVELWPNWFNRRRNWILIDEKEVENDVAVDPADLTFE
jgi:hypothetical protein